MTYLRLKRWRALAVAIACALVAGALSGVSSSTASGDPLAQAVRDGAVGQWPADKQAGAGSHQSAIRPAMCPPAALRLSLADPISPQTGEHGREFELTNRSAYACRLFGYPKLAFYRGQRRLAFQMRDGGGYVSARRPRPVVLAPGGHAYFLAAKHRCDGKAARQATSIHVTLARGQRSVTADLGPGESVSAFDYCRHYPGGPRVDPGNRVDVSPIVATRSAAFA